MTKNFTTFILSLLFFIIGARHVFAQIDSWPPRSSPSKIVYSVAVDPLNPNFIYAASYRGGIFKSIDGGESWNSISKGLPKYRDYPIVYSLSIDSTPNHLIIYVATSNGVFKSTNGGEDWYAMNQGLPKVPFAVSIALDPQNQSVIYAATPRKLFKSINAGEFWTPVGLKLSNSPYRHPILIDSQNSSNLYVGTNYKNGLVLKSENAGKTWLVSKKGIIGRRSFGLSLAADPRQSSILYLGTNRGFYKSVDAGETWKLSVAKVRVWTIMVDPQNPSILYLGTENRGILKSGDTGKTWDKHSVGLPDMNVYSIALDPRNSNVLYAGTFTGIAKSINAGRSWKTLTLGATKTESTN